MAFFQGFDFVHHLLIDGQTTGGIDDDEVAILLAGLFYGVLSYLDGLFVVGLGIDRYPYLLTEHSQLFDGGGTIHVAGHEHGALGPLGAQHLGQLAREGGFTRTLETRHQDDGRRAGDIDVDCFSTHEFGEFVVNDFHHELAGFYRGEHIHTHGFGLYRVGKLLGDLVIDIGIEQRFAHLFQGFGYVDFGDTAFAFEHFE